jgi:flagellar basal-body rod protein FlgB
MYIKAMFDQGSLPVLEKSLSFYEQRNRVLVNNIANFDTPNYLRRDLPVAEFQAQLAKAVEERGRANPRVFHFSASDNIEPNALGGVNAQTVIDPLQRDQFLRHDGNNVNIHMEMAELAKNNLIHSTMSQILVKEFAMLSTAISEKITR